MSFRIENIIAREILDSRGNPTIEVDLQVKQIWHRASVPSGASTGSHEALELRDADPKRFLGKGVQKCIQTLHATIAPAILNKSFDSAQALDKALLELDGTPNKSKLGANTILAISMAFHRAYASTHHKTLFEYLHQHYFADKKMSAPIPMMNVINGGVHADNDIQIQEFMVCPHLSSPQAPIHERIRAGVEVYHHLKKILHERNYTTNVGDEGGFAPSMKNESEALEIMCQAIQQAGYSVGKDVSLALDVASNEFYSDQKYKIDLKQPAFNSSQLAEFYGQLFKKFPAIISIEDPFAEDDWEGWQHFTQQMVGEKSQLMIIGDDLLVTHPTRLKKAISSKSCNAILIKLNQIGSVSETAQTMNQATEAGFKCIVSHRSGETEDPFIAHLVTASGAGWIKTGAPCRSDRNAKYNELLRIFINK